MTAITKEKVLEVVHWNDRLFSVKTTRDNGLRFANGQFLMLGMEIEGKPLLRAYSLASVNYASDLEFLSIKVPNGPLTSHLQHLKEGDTVLVSTKPVGTLKIDDLRPGRHLYLFATGTGLAPFMSIIRDLETYEKYQKIVLIHGVRRAADLAYRTWIETVLPNDEYLGELAKNQFLYYPTVTREPFVNSGRITTLFKSGRMNADLALPPLDPELDRAMICGSQEMLNDVSEMLNNIGFQVSPGLGEQGDYVIERAFSER